MDTENDAIHIKSHNNKRPKNFPEKANYESLICSVGCKIYCFIPQYKSLIPHLFNKLYMFWS